MKISIALAAAIVLFSFGSGHAAPATDLEKFEKQVAKVAPPYPEKGKVLCGCAASDAFYANRVGYVQQYVDDHQLHVLCNLEIFTSAGDLLGYATCNDFYLLK